MLGRRQPSLEEVRRNLRTVYQPPVSQLTEAVSQLSLHDVNTPRPSNSSPPRPRQSLDIVRLRNKFESLALRGENKVSNLSRSVKTENGSEKMNTNQKISQTNGNFYKVYRPFCKTPSRVPKMKLWQTAQSTLTVNSVPCNNTKLPSPNASNNGFKLNKNNKNNEKWSSVPLREKSKDIFQQKQDHQKNDKLTTVPVENINLLEYQRQRRKPEYLGPTIHLLHPHWRKIPWHSRYGWTDRHQRHCDWLKKQVMRGCAPCIYYKSTEEYELACDESKRTKLLPGPIANTVAEVLAIIHRKRDKIDESDLTLTGKDLESKSDNPEGQEMETNNMEQVLDM